MIKLTWVIATQMIKIFYPRIKMIKTWQKETTIKTRKTIKTRIKIKTNSNKIRTMQTPMQMTKVKKMMMMKMVKMMTKYHLIRTQCQQRKMKIWRMPKVKRIVRTQILMGMARVRKIRMSKRCKTLNSMIKVVKKTRKWMTRMQVKRMTSLMCFKTKTRQFQMMIKQRQKMSRIMRITSKMMLPISKRILRNSRQTSSNRVMKIGNRTSKRTKRIKI